MRIVRYLLIALILLWPGWAFAENLYLAHGADGSDPNCSTIAPFTTAGCAAVCLDEADFNNAANWGGAGDDSIDAGDTVYVLDDGGNLSILVPQGSGGLGTEITIAAYTGESPIIDASWGPSTDWSDPGVTWTADGGGLYHTAHGLGAGNPIGAIWCDGLNGRWESDGVPDVKGEFYSDGTNFWLHTGDAGINPNSMWDVIIAGKYSSGSRLEPVDTNGKDYLIFDGLTFKYYGYFAFYVNSNSTNITVQNCTVQYCGTGINVRTGSTGFVADNNTISHLGFQQAQDATGFLIRAEDSQISNNYIDGRTYWAVAGVDWYANNGIKLDFNDAMDGPDGARVYNNTILYTQYIGIHVSCQDSALSPALGHDANIEIYDNIVRYMHSGTGDSDGIGIGGTDSTSSNYLTGIKIYRNWVDTFYNVGIHAADYDGNGVEIYSNLVSNGPLDPTGAGGGIYGSHGSVIYNNTIYGCTYESGILIYGYNDHPMTGITAAVVANNAIQNMDDQYGINNTPQAGWTIIESNNSIFDVPVGQEVNGVVQTNAINLNQDFLDITSSPPDLRLYGYSPCVGTGVLGDVEKHTEANAAADRDGEADGTVGWAETGGGSWASVPTNGVVPPKGTYMLEYTMSADNDDAYYTTTLNSGRIYICQFWIYQDGGTGDDELFSINLGTSEGDTTYYTENWTTVDTWMRYTINFTASSANFYFTLAETGVAQFDGKIYVDDFTLRGLDTTIIDPDIIYSDFGQGGTVTTWEQTSYLCGSNNMVGAYGIPNTSVCANNSEILSTVINPNAVLWIGSGLTGVIVDNCTIAGLLYSVSDFTARNLAVLGEMEIGGATNIGGGTVCENWALAESEAVIEAKSVGTRSVGTGTIDNTDAATFEFSFTNWYFVDESGEDYNLTRKSGLINTGSSNSTADTDVDGVSMPQRGYFDIGAHELESTAWLNPTRHSGWWYFW